MGNHVLHHWNKTLLVVFQPDKQSRVYDHFLVETYIVRDNECHNMGGLQYDKDNSICKCDVNSEMVMYG